MKCFLEIVDNYWGKNNEMIYKNKDGELYKGSPFSFTADSTIFVEVSEGKMSDGYYHIIRFISSFKNKK